MLPLLPGVYIIRDKGGAIIYIGKAKRLKTRVSQYFREGVPHENKVEKMILNAFEFDVIVTQSEFEALVLECSQIKQHLPKYNILLKDDKGYSYIKLSHEEYPRITAELQKNDDDAEYIGPYTSSFAVRELVESTNMAFRLPTCRRRFPQDLGKGRPCLNAQIGRCMALCTGRISHAEYMDAINGAMHMIRYGQGDILKTLRERMADASERMDYEKAAAVRDQIRAIEKASSGQKVVSGENKEQDVVAFASDMTAVCAAVLRFRAGHLVDKQEFVLRDTRDIAASREELMVQYYTGVTDIPKVIAVDEMFESALELETLLSDTRKAKVQIYVPQRGDNAKLIAMARLNAVERLARESGRYAREQRILDELAALLGLDKAPQTIESYDISNWGEGTSVAGMIVFENAKPKRDGYRRFKMRTVPGTDDYASMAETLQRRAQEYENGGKGQFGILPDLILLDGGKGQLSAALAAVRCTKLASVPMFGMVKDDRHRTRAIVGEGGEISISMNKNIFAFITSIQDEVHRFAIAYQRQGQNAKSYSSSLLQIEGIGAVRAKALMRHFKSVAAIKAADIEMLSNAEGVGKAAATLVYNHFHDESTK